MTDPATLATLLDEMRDTPSRKPVLRLRRKTCGCWLASVYRLPSGHLVLGEKRALAAVTSTTKKTATPFTFGWNLAEPPGGGDALMDEFACRHGAPRVDVAALRDAVAAAATGHGPRVLTL